MTTSNLSRAVDDIYEKQFLDSIMPTIAVKDRQSFDIGLSYALYDMKKASFWARILYVFFPSRVYRMTRKDPNILPFEQGHIVAGDFGKSTPNDGKPIRFHRILRPPITTKENGEEKDNNEKKMKITYAKFRKMLEKSHYAVDPIFRIGQLTEKADCDNLHWLEKDTTVVVECHPEWDCNYGGGLAHAEVHGDGSLAIWGKPEGVPLKEGEWVLCGTAYPEGLQDAST